MEHSPTWSLWPRAFEFDPVAGLPDWIRAAHKGDVISTARREFDARMARAIAAPWRRPGDIEPARPQTEMQSAVQFYSTIRNRHDYYPGINDGLGDVTEKAKADALFNGWDDGQCVVIMPDERPDLVAEETNEKASLYLGLCKQHTGETIPEDVLQQRRTDSVKLLEMSHEIAGRLESEGFKAYRDDQFSLYHFYVHSNHVEKIPQFRRVVIVPYVAAMTRSNMLTAAEYFVENNPFCRFWTFTSGSRCNVLQIRERLQKLHRKVSLLNSAPFMIEAGLEIVLRSSELGTPETGEECSTWNISGEIEQENGEFLFHPHAHCIVSLRKGFIKKEKWSLILKQVWEFWGDQWDEGKGINNVRECLKYVTKPGEMLKLPTATLAELAKQLRRLKLAQPMGLLAEQIKARKEARKKLIRCATPDGPVLRDVINWNLAPVMSDDMKDRLAARRLDVSSPKDMLRIVSRLLPSIGPAGVKEPRVVVITNRALNVAELRQHPAVAPVIACSEDEFFAGRAIRVHTCTSTVLPGLDIFEISSWKPPPEVRPVSNSPNFAKQNSENLVKT